MSQVLVCFASVAKETMEEAETVLQGAGYQSKVEIGSLEVGGEKASVVRNTTFGRDLFLLGKSNQHSQILTASEHELHWPRQQCTTRQP